MACENESSRKLFCSSNQPARISPVRYAVKIQYLGNSLICIHSLFEGQYIMYLKICRERTLINSWVIWSPGDQGFMVTHFLRSSTSIHEDHMHEIAPPLDQILKSSEHWYELGTVQVRHKVKMQVNTQSW